MEAISETSLKDWRINVPDSAGVCTDENKEVKTYEITPDTIDPHYVDHASPEEVKRTRERVKERMRADGHRNFANSAMEGVHTELLPTAYDDTDWKHIDGDADAKDKLHRVRHRVKKDLGSPEGQAKTWGAITVPTEKVEKDWCQDRPRHRGPRTYVGPRLASPGADGIRTGLDGTPKEA